MLTEQYEPTNTISGAALHSIEEQVRRLCARYARRLTFHGWHHVDFVRTKSIEFAKANGADCSAVEAAALVHDMNYLVRRGSSASAGEDVRTRILNRAGVAASTTEHIEGVITDAEMAGRERDICLEAQALSDADTLFKALPVTPVVLAHRYLSENDINLRELADKILGEQRPVHDEGYYFYDPQAAATYSRWATANLELWQCVREALDEPSVRGLLNAIGQASEASSLP